MLDTLDYMRLAIIMAEKCNPTDPTKTPKVGAVIVSGDEIVAMASRGEEDHAEKIALEEALKIRGSLSGVTVYTTLEPCVPGVRRLANESCADRLISAKVGKVVIGIHDPNLEVCGKGFLHLQEANISIELFPDNLAQRIKVINREFILAQRRIGAKITFPSQEDAPTTISVKDQKFFVMRGTWTNPPTSDELVAVVRKGVYWWPQGKLVSDGDNKWSVKIHIGSNGPHEVFVGKINRLGKILMGYYDRVKNEILRWDDVLKANDPAFVLPGSPWIGIEGGGSDPPKGIDIEDRVSFNITDYEH